MVESISDLEDRAQIGVLPDRRERERVVEETGDVPQTADRRVVREEVHIVELEAHAQTVGVRGADADGKERCGQEGEPAAAERNHLRPWSLGTWHSTAWPSTRDGRFCVALACASIHSVAARTLQPQ